MWKLLKAERTAHGSCERKKLLRAKVMVISKPPTYLSGSAFLVGAYETVFKIQHLQESENITHFQHVEGPGFHISK